MPDDTQRTFEWLPRGFMPVCATLITNHHRKWGGSLPKILWHRETMVFVMMHEDLRILLLAATSARKMVVASGVTAVVAVIFGMWLRAWIAIITVPAVAALMYFRRSESKFYNLLLAIIFALEILAKDVAGCADLFPDAAQKARNILDEFLPNHRTRLLDIYLPRRNGMARGSFALLTKN